MIMGIILNFRLGDTANSRFSTGLVVRRKIITGRAIHTMAAWRTHVVQVLPRVRGGELVGSLGSLSESSSSAARMLGASKSVTRDRFAATRMYLFAVDSEKSIEPDSCCCFNHGNHSPCFKLAHDSDHEPDHESIQ